MRPSSAISATCLTLDMHSLWDSFSPSRKMLTSTLNCCHEDSFRPTYDSSSSVWQAHSRHSRNGNNKPAKFRDLLSPYANLRSKRWQWTSGEEGLNAVTRGIMQWDVHGLWTDASCVILGKLLNFAVSRFPSPWTEATYPHYALYVLMLLNRPVRKPGQTHKKERMMKASPIRISKDISMVWTELKTLNDFYLF